MGLTFLNLKIPNSYMGLAFLRFWTVSSGSEDGFGIIYPHLPQKSILYIGMFFLVEFLMMDYL